MLTRSVFTLEDFVQESNRIEGIHRRPTYDELEAHKEFLAHDNITVSDLEKLVSVIAPGAKLRNQPGMDVRVGSHFPLAGGPEVEIQLMTLIMGVNTKLIRNVKQHQTPPSPWEVHCRYENLHPFMDGNGRSGRALWLWCMGGMDRAPLGFLHHFYYQTLDQHDQR